MRRSSAIVGAIALLAFALMATAAHAATGCDVTISTGTTTNATFTPGSPQGVWSVTGDSAVINVTTLDGELATGNVFIHTNGCTGTQSGNLTVSSAISQSSGTHSLDLQSDATNGGDIVLDSGISIGGDLTFGTSVSLVSSPIAVSAGTGTTAFNGPVDGADTLAVTGAATFYGPVGGTTPLTSLSVSGTTDFLSGISHTMKTTGNQTYSGAVTLENSLTATSTGGTVAFDSTVNGSNALSVVGQSTFAAAVGGTTALSSLTANGASTLDASVTTTGIQSYEEAVTLGGDVTATSSGGGAILFAGTINGAHSLSASTAGATTFDGVVGGTTQLTDIDVESGPATIDTSSVNTTGGQTYSGAVTLGADVDATAGGAGVTFDTTVNGAHNLLVGGQATFAAAVGATNALQTLSVSGTASLGGNVTTGGSQGYVGAVTLAANVQLTSNTAQTVSFSSTVNGAHSLDVVGQSTFAAAVGATTALSSLTADGASTLDVSMTTTGAQDYEGAVTLGGNVTASSSGGAAITFTSTIDGGHSLVPNTTGTTTFEGPVGGTTPLTELDVDTGPATLDGNVTTTEGQLYQAAVTLGATVTLQNMGNFAITFYSTIDGAHALTVTTPSVTIFEGAVGGTTALASLSVNDGQAAFSGGNVTTTGGQSYESVAFNADTTLSMGGASSMAGSVGGSDGLIKEGAGTLTLSHSPNNYGGGTTVDDGLVEFGPSGLGLGPITLNGGGLEWASGNTTDISPSLTAIGSGGATFDTNGNPVTFASPLTGTGPLMKTGAGTLTLSAVNTDAGAMDLEGGSLDVPGTLPGAVTVDGGATLNITGTVGGAVTVQSSGTLACTSGGTLSGGVTNNGGTATSVPGAPTGVSATAGNGSATVSFTPGAANCLPLDSYTVTASPGGAHASGSGSPITVTGLTPGTSYTFTVTASNPIGTSVSSGGSNAVTPAGSSGGSGGSGGSSSTAPTLWNVKQSHTKWREAKKRKVKKPPVGTTFSFTLNEQAQVTFMFTKQLAGRKAGKRCVAQTKRNAHKHACKRMVSKGTLTVAGKAGQNTVAFDGKKPKLRPGRYKVTVVASASGKSSRSAKLSFTIEKS